jgi:hypothetical protein
VDDLDDEEEAFAEDITEFDRVPGDRFVVEDDMLFEEELEEGIIPQ